MKPIIGVIGRPSFPDEDSNKSLIAIKESYRKLIIKFGAVPLLILPPKLIDYNNSKPSDFSELTSDDKEILEQQLKLCDGILIPGGYKVFSHDFYILDYAIKNDIPVLGICLGMQIMSNYNCEYFNKKMEGNHIHYDISGKTSHNVTIDKESKLFSILGKEQIYVNSMHNYCATKGGIYNVVGKSEDEIIEALELPNARFNIGVQWHPELLDNEDSKKLIKQFIVASSNSRKCI